MVTGPSARGDTEPTEGESSQTTSQVELKFVMVFVTKMVHQDDTTPIQKWRRKPRRGDSSTEWSMFLTLTQARTNRPTQPDGIKVNMVLTKEEIAKDLRDILELPTGKRIKTSKAYKIVTTVIKGLTKEILKNGKVRIDGLGTFTIRTRPSVRKSCVYHYHHDHSAKRRLIRVIPPKKYVHFKPAKAIIKNLNQDNNGN